MSIVFSQTAAVADSVFGKSQEPIQKFIETKVNSAKEHSNLSYMFDMQSSNTFASKITGMTSMDEFTPVGEGGEYPETEGFAEGYDKVIAPDTWKSSFKITQEAVEDSMLINFKKRPQAFVDAYIHTRERFGASLYGAAALGQNSVSFGERTFSTLGADKVNVFSTNHKCKIKGADQCNKFSNAFSEDALGLVSTAMQNFYDDNGVPLSVSPDTIMIPNLHSLKKAVFSAIGSDKDPSSSNNAFNYQYGQWTVIINPYLNPFCSEGNTPWFVMDSNYNKNYSGAVWIDRVELAIKSWIDDKNDNNIWGGRSRYSAGFADFRFCAVGGVTGGTELTA